MLALVDGAVHVSREGWARVPQLLADHSQRHATAQHQRGVSVAQAVNADGTHSSKWGKS